MKAFWRFVADNLGHGMGVGMLCVVNHQGSTPGKQGFKMAVTMEGDLCGTIGGGIMEHRLVEKLKSMMSQEIPGLELLTQVHHEKAPPEFQSGMICAGTQDIAMLILKPSDLSTVTQILTAMDEKKPTAILLSNHGFTCEASEIDAAGFHFVKENDFQWSYREVMGKPNTVYICGGGHVGLALSRQMALLDFHVVVFDSREDVDTMARNSFAHEKLVMPYEEIGAYVEEGSHAYGIVVTAAYPSDIASLKALLQKDLRLLGVMGSKAKLERIFATLREEGIDESRLAKVKAPVGLEIGNRTPAEIAVSIAAQIIGEKNEEG